MENRELAKNLCQLIQLDIDAVFAYEQAIERVEVLEIKEQLRFFQGDHERHIADLSNYVVALGERPPERSRDFKGFLIEGFTALRSVTGTEGALKAMQSNEKTTNKQYDEALSWELPADARAIVERNYEDEKRHLRYITEALEARKWEHAA